MTSIFDNIESAPVQKSVDYLNKGEGDNTKFGHVLSKCKRSYVSYFETLVLSLIGDKTMQTLII